MEPMKVKEMQRLERVRDEEAHVWSLIGVYEV